jgi:hypothetical protein
VILLSQVIDISRARAPGKEAALLLMEAERHMMSELNV